MEHHSEISDSFWLCLKKLDQKFHITFDCNYNYQTGRIKLIEI